MLKFERILSLMEDLSNDLGIQVRRAEHSFTRPQLPFATYKLIQERPDSLAQKEVVILEQTDATIFKSEQRRRGFATVGLNFYGNNLPTLRELAEAAKDYLDQYDFLGNDMGAPDFSEIEDRTIFLETDWESRIGFNFTFEYVNLATLEIDAIDIDATFAEITGEPE